MLIYLIYIGFMILKWIPTTDGKYNEILFASVICNSELFGLGLDNLTPINSYVPINQFWGHGWTMGQKLVNCLLHKTHWVFSATRWQHSGYSFTVVVWQCPCRQEGHLKCSTYSGLPFGFNHTSPSVPLICSSSTLASHFQNVWEVY